MCLVFFLSFDGLKYLWARIHHNPKRYQLTTYWRLEYREQLLLAPEQMHGCCLPYFTILTKGGGWA
jgi:hypothetical protein